MKNPKEFKLTASVTVGKLEEWILLKDDESKERIIGLIKHRFENRYLKHAEIADSGFLKMAICCLLIETFESFKQGLLDTKMKSRTMFSDFFQSESQHFVGFNPASIKFYDDIRCGILHQAETRNAWRILLDSSPLIDISERTINADVFVTSLRTCLNDYYSRLNSEPFTNDIWKKALDKLVDICKNCEVTT